MVTRSEQTAAYLKTLHLPAGGHDLPYLNRIIAGHVATFAFSSVGCRLGDELPLDFDSLFDRIVTRRRGGYCFEQNGLLFTILDNLGFEPTLYLARVIYNQDTHPGLTHRISVVDMDGAPHVVDVGFGPQGPRVAVPMTGAPTNDGGKIYRVFEKHPGQHHLQVLKDGDFFSLYRFERARYGQSDCEVGHFYSHKHPDASFVNHLVVSRILADEVRSLRDLDYRIIRDQDIRDTPIVSAPQMEQILVQELGIEISAAEARRLYEDLKEE